METYLSLASEDPLDRDYGIFLLGKGLSDSVFDPQENPDVFHKYFPGGMKRISSIKAEDDIELSQHYDDPKESQKKEELLFGEIQASA